MQSKIIIKLVKIKKLDTLCCQGCGNEHSHMLLVEREINTTLERAIWNTEQNLKRSTIPLQGTYPTDILAHMQCDMYKNMFIIAKD